MTLFAFAKENEENEEEKTWRKCLEATKQFKLEFENQKVS